MKITQVEYGELKSTENYGNVQIKCVATLDANDTIASAIHELRGLVKWEMEKATKHRKKAIQKLEKFIEGEH